ncbi:magnesium protoporphyrin IX methyltransferase [Histidinibacterium aquaticum]|uniref:Magnesium protoporphyrin IX methyltransferase n=1 Tax=Histidinibacterium aquaticum TaxID=2613962 RepID=A0A5J5GFC4_9RHOB|nr:magnesium protoporphyrin IX methyltransferase [Histidinibacterium aquaticum]KAA9006875.1 magnesium protoporphyrin IX methyltransferase [Histidinibacterium aquaticum]
MRHAATLSRVEHYFDRTATRTWERLTSDAPVSGIRATVRAGRDRMRAALLAELPADLTGQRVLDAGCGTGALAVELARRGAEVTAVDIAPKLVQIARERAPAGLGIDFRAGDLADAGLGRFDHVVAMDSLIYYDGPELAELLGRLRPRVSGRIVFTLAPRTPLLMAMWRVGRLFPRSDRSPVMVPQSGSRLAAALREARVPGNLRERERVTSGFYISTAFVHESARPRGSA